METVENINEQIISFLDESIHSFNVILELIGADDEVQEAIRIAAGKCIDIYKSNMQRYERLIDSISDINIINSINEKMNQMYALIGKVVMKYDITIKDDNYQNKINL